MKLLSIALLLVMSMTACQQKGVKLVQEVNSPNLKNKITFELAAGVPMYSVTHGDKKVINPSKLGFVFKNGDSLSENLEIIDSKQTTFDETWEQVWGEKKMIRNHYNQLAVTLQEKGDSKRTLEIQFRAFDEGVAFRYLYPKQGKDSLVIMDELTTFSLSEDGDAWWIGAYQDNRYEYLYTKSPVSTLDTVHTPLTIKSKS